MYMYVCVQVLNPVYTEKNWALPEGMSKEAVCSSRVIIMQYGWRRKWDLIQVW